MSINELTRRAAIDKQKRVAKHQGWIAFVAANYTFQTQRSWATRRWRMYRLFDLSHVDPRKEGVG
jgi:hypothetical protein